MQLVDLLSTAWGAAADGNGKIVWFELTTDPIGDDRGCTRRLDRIGVMEESPTAA